MKKSKIKIIDLPLDMKKKAAKVKGGSQSYTFRPSNSIGIRLPEVRESGLTSGKIGL